MSKFKVGERVAVYQCEKRWLDKVARMNGELLFFECLGGPFHPKQCRKLVKKKRREFWVNAGWAKYVNIRTDCEFYAPVSEVEPEDKTSWFKVRVVK